MSETGKVVVGREASSLDVSPQFEAYSGVEIVVDEDTTHFAGNRAGRILRIENPWGTLAQAQSILESLQANGFQYQPYTASGAMLNPAAEIGDGVTINDIYSGLYKVNRKYSHLAASDIEAPQDEEIDHEYPYEPKQDRIYSREIAETKSQISVTASAITAEVSRATAAEGTLRSSISANATSITAKVSKTGGSSSSFAWALTDSSWTLTAGNKTVLKATSSGIEINGKVTATSGYIGNGSNGFTISSKAIYNGVTSLSDTAHSGVYVGTDGIVCGKGAFKVTSAGAITATNLTITGGSINLGSGAFKVTSSGAVTASNLTVTGGSIRIGSNFTVNSSGNVTANNMTLSGTLTVGGAQITAADLRTGAARANAGYSSWDGTTSMVNTNYGNWNAGYGYGVFSNNAFNNNARVTYMNCNTLTAGTAGISQLSIPYGSQSFAFAGSWVAWRSMNVVTSLNVTRAYNSTLGQYVVSFVSPSTTTIYYLGR